MNISAYLSIKYLFTKYPYNNMKIFKTVPVNIWEIGMIKLAVACLGIAIGATWANTFASYTTLLLVVSLVVGIYTFLLWMKK
jgi:hypothetical protein